MAVDYAENFREEHFIRRGQGVRGRGGRGLQCYAGFKDGDINWDIMGLCNITRFSELFLGTHLRNVSAFNALRAVWCVPTIGPDTQNFSMSTADEESVKDGAHGWRKKLDLPRLGPN